MRVIVCGGRAYSKRAVVFAALDQLHDHHRITCIVTGGALGADTLALDWARVHHVDTEVYTANWREFGRNAGPMRNQRMAESGADLLIAFSGGKGTANMIDVATEHNIPVRIVPDAGESE